MKTLRVENLKKYYKNKDGSTIRAIDGINLDIEIGSFTAIVGVSGSGKTTLLRCMSGLDRPTDGRVYIDDVDIYKMSDDYISKLRRREYGFVFQEFRLLPLLNVYDNIVFPVSLDNSRVDIEYLMRLIDRMDLKGFLKKYPDQLSGGYKQRVAIARALSNKPSVIFADEPTGNLDSKSAKEVVRILRDSVRIYGKTLVMITHDENISAMADRVITLDNGKI